MKVLIDIDEKVYKHIKEHSGLAYAVEDYLHEVEWAIKKGTPLFEGATNGDVIKAVFPNTPFNTEDFFVRDKYDNIRCWKDWWNAPYKAEREVKE